MAGPNDIGALRGIIGDGQSMNDEDVRNKAYGKRPGADNKIIPVKVPVWPPEKQFTYFGSGGKNVMDVMNKFNLRGQNRHIDPSVPHVVNKILRDNYALNKDNDNVLLDIPPQQPQPQTKTVSIPDKPSNKDLKKDPNRQLVTVKSHTFTMPGVNLDLSQKNKKGALNIPLGKKERLNISLDKSKKGRGTYKFETSAIVPTATGLKNFAGDLADNLGKTFSSGALVGPFQNPNEEQKVSKARLQLQAYLSFLYKKYKTQNIQNKVDPREQYKLTVLKQQLEKQQKSFTQSGFLSGGGATGILATSQPRMNFPQFTQPTTPRIQFSELGQGIAYPEAVSRLGVQQNLASGGQLDAYNQNKWDVMLNRSSPDQKISNILGKAPDPLGKSTGESASAKIKRLSGM